MSFWDNALGLAGDVASGVGYALDTPGRLARNAIGDLAGLRQGDEDLSGRDLVTRGIGSTGSELADSVIGFGADLALDPTTYLGGAIGRTAGRALGGAAEAAAKAAGPGYATTVDDLAGMAAGRFTPAGSVGDQIRDIFKAAPQAASEIPAGSSLLGAGAEAVAFRTPAGDVVRAGLTPLGTPGRPVDDAILQATRGIDYPAYPKATLRVERVPFADGANTGLTAPGLPRTGAVGEDDISLLARELEGRGIDFYDKHAGNVAYHGGRPVVIDPGAVDSFLGYKGPYQEVAAAAQPGRPMSALLSALGGQGATRRALDRGLAGPQYQRLLGNLGMTAGASLGAS